MSFGNGVCWNCEQWLLESDVYTGLYPPVGDARVVYQMPFILQTACPACRVVLKYLAQASGKSIESLAVLDSEVIIKTQNRLGESPKEFFTDIKDILKWLPASDDAKVRRSSVVIYCNDIGIDTASLSFKALYSLDSPPKVLSIELLEIPPIDPQIIADWLKICDSHDHPNVYLELKLSLPSQLRLIDVKKRHIVSGFDPKHPPKYAALSYMWETPAAGKSIFQLEYESLSDFFSPGHLRGSRVPRLLEDCMELCDRIGYRYLWIDRYCIMQSGKGSDEDKRDQIAFMGSIYSLASLTVVCAINDRNGPSLPGWMSERSPSPAPYTPRAAPSGTFGDYQEAVEKVQTSAWNSRAWTFQEYLLAPRKLYVTESEVIFECRCGYALESFSWYLPEDYRTTRTSTLSTGMCASQAAMAGFQQIRRTMSATMKNTLRVELGRTNQELDPAGIDEPPLIMKAFDEIDLLGTLQRRFDVEAPWSITEALIEILSSQSPSHHDFIRVCSVLSGLGTLASLYGCKDEMQAAVSHLKTGIYSLEAPPLSETQVQCFKQCLNLLQRIEMLAYIYTEPGVSNSLLHCFEASNTVLLNSKTLDDIGVPDYLKQLYPSYSQALQVFGSVLQACGCLSSALGLEDSMPVTEDSPPPSLLCSTEQWRYLSSNFMGLKAEYERSYRSYFIAFHTRKTQEHIQALMHALPSTPHLSVQRDSALKETLQNLPMTSTWLSSGTDLLHLERLQRLSSASTRLWEPNDLLDSILGEIAKDHDDILSIDEPIRNFSSSFFDLYIQSKGFVREMTSSLSSASTDSILSVRKSDMHPLVQQLASYEQSLAAVNSQMTPLFYRAAFKSHSTVLKFLAHYSKRDASTTRTHSEQFIQIGIDYNYLSQLFQHYNVRHLSYPGDVLFAISGITSVISTRTKSQFLFGLVDSSMVWSLLWSTNNNTTRLRDVSGIPTWSWAHLFGPVYHQSLPSDMKSYVVSMFYANDGGKLCRLDIGSDVIEDGDVLTQESALSDQKYGFSVSNAPVNQVQWKPYSLVFTAIMCTIKYYNRQRRFGGSRFQCEGEEDPLQNWETFFDCEKVDSVWVDTVLLAVDNSGKKIMGLMLQRLEHHDSGIPIYQRTSFVEFRNEQWFGDTTNSVKSFDSLKTLFKVRVEPIMLC